jgi:hypothetical protein
MDAIFDIGFGLAVGPNDDLMLALNSGDAAGRAMVRLTDLNGDGDYLDDGETVVWGSAVGEGGFIARARTVEFIARVPMPAPIWLMSVGVAGIALGRRSRRREADSRDCLPSPFATYAGSVSPMARKPAFSSMPSAATAQSLSRARRGCKAGVEPDAVQSSRPASSLTFASHAEIRSSVSPGSLSSSKPTPMK